MYMNAWIYISSLTPLASLGHPREPIRQNPLPLGIVRSVYTDLSSQPRIKMDNRSILTLVITAWDQQSILTQRTGYVPCSYPS